MAFFKSLVDKIRQGFDKGLEKTREAFIGGVQGLRNLLLGRALDEALIDQLQVTLLRADVGLATTTRLIDRIRDARHADGALVFTLPMVIGLMVFYALCLQCISTLAVIRRETNSWRWPLASWLYMTGLGYAGAFLCFRFGGALFG